MISYHEGELLCYTTVIPYNLNIICTLFPHSETLLHNQ